MKRAKFLMVALLFATCNLVNAQSARAYIKAYEKVLEAYCLEFYNTDFSGRLYIEGSLSVSIPYDPEDVFNPLTGNFELTGTHSYRGRTRSVHSGVKFRATIKQIGQGRYRVKFDKWYEKDPVPEWLGGQPAHWENGATREFRYE